MLDFSMYADPSVDPLSNVDPNDWSSEVSPTPGAGAGSENVFATGGAASNTPVQGSSTGAQILGWLGLANNIANTALNSSRTGYTTRPGVNRTTASLGSFGSVTTTTLLVIVAIFVGVVFLLRGK